MKTLFDYITEAREYFNPEFGLAEIKVLFDGIKENDECDDEILNGLCPAGMDIHTANAILTAYFYSKSGMNGKVTDEGCQKFLDMIRKQPVDRIKRIMGAGSEGMIYNIGQDRVMKVIFDTDFLGSKDINNRVLRSMVGRHFTTLPNVYKVTNTYIIREDVKPSTKECIRYWKVATTRNEEMKATLGAPTMEHAVARHDREKVEDLVADTDKDVMEWLYTLKEELQSVGIPVNNNFGDFKSANLGETKDRRVVYFDW